MDVGDRWAQMGGTKCATDKRINDVEDGLERRMFPAIEVRALNAAACYCFCYCYCQ